MILYRCLIFTYDYLEFRLVFTIKQAHTNPYKIVCIMIISLLADLMPES